MRIIFILLMIILLAIPTCIAGDIEIYSKYVLIPIGGYNTTDFTIILNEDDGIGKYHFIIIKFFDESGKLTDKITGELISEEVQLVQMPSRPGTLKYKYYVPEAGFYNFTLRLWFKDNVKVGEKFDIYIDDKYIKGIIPKITASGFAYAEAIPELTTVILAGIGLSALLIRRKIKI